MPAIDLSKGKSESADYIQEEKTQAMQAAINEFFNHLVVKHAEFVTFAGCVCIGSLIFAAVKKLAIATDVIKSDK